jgi:putative RecB family exonuclease
VNHVFAVPVSGTDKPLIGEVDLITENAGKVVLGDWKTSARRWPKNKADLDLQPTVSIYGYKQTHGALPPFKFTVVVKNKTPVVEGHETLRGEEHFSRLAELIKVVESMVTADHFLPNEQSYYCGHCQFQEACKAWHKNRNKLISVAA